MIYRFKKKGEKHKISTLTTGKEDKADIMYADSSKHIRQPPYPVAQHVKANSTPGENVKDLLVF